MGAADKVLVAGVVTLFAGVSLFPVLSDNPKRFLTAVSMLGSLHGAEWLAVGLIVAGVLVIALSCIFRRD